MLVRKRSVDHYYCKALVLIKPTADFMVSESEKVVNHCSKGVNSGVDGSWGEGRRKKPPPPIN